LFCDWAFNLQRSPEIQAKWELILEDTDVQSTHGPSFGIGNLTIHKGHTGNEDLHEVLNQYTVYHEISEFNSEISW